MRKFTDFRRQKKERTDQRKYRVPNFLTLNNERNIDGYRNRD